MGTTRGSLEARLTALEQRRDQMLDRMIDRFIERERVLLGDRFREFNDALRDGIQPTPELTAIVEADPETQRLYRVYWQIAKWREYIENAIPRTRRRRAT